jgi:pimeloyl-ACP methyl ester carboxylesterase
MPTSVQDWRDGGRSLPMTAGNVFVRSSPGYGLTVMLLHGYPSSSFDFRKVVPRLTGRAWLDGKVINQQTSNGQYASVMCSGY